jgi:hypothetical protein
MVLFTARKFAKTRHAKTGFVALHGLSRARARDSPEGATRTRGREPRLARSRPRFVLPPPARRPGGASDPRRPGNPANRRPAARQPRQPGSPAARRRGGPAARRPPPGQPASPPGLPLGGLPAAAPGTRVERGARSPPHGMVLAPYVSCIRCSTSHQPPENSPEARPGRSASPRRVGGALSAEADRLARSSHELTSMMVNTSLTGPMAGRVRSPCSARGEERRRCLVDQRGLICRHRNWNPLAT